MPPSSAKHLIVSAHAVYPAPNNAEGVVNAAWLDALREQWAVELVTSPHGYQSLAPPKRQRVSSAGIYWH